MPLASIPSPPHARVHLGPVTLRWQALAIVAGILLAIWLADRRYRAAGGPRGAMTDVAAWAVPAGLIPAAIGALTAQAHGGWQTVRTWDAVLGFPGALALGILGAWLACRRLRRRPAAENARAHKAPKPAPALAPAHTKPPARSSRSRRSSPPPRSPRSSRAAGGCGSARWPPPRRRPSPSAWRWPRWGTGSASRASVTRARCRGRSRSRPRTGPLAMRTSPHSSRSSCTRRCGPRRPESAWRSRPPAVAARRPRARAVRRRLRGRRFRAVLAGYRTPTGCLWPPGGRAR